MQENKRQSVSEVKKTYDEAYSLQKNINIMGTRIDPEYSEQTKRRLVENCVTAPDGKILEIGTGDGDMGQFLTSGLPEREWVGIDISSVGLQVARTENQNLMPAVASMAELPFADESFAAVILADTLEHSPDIKKTLQEIRRVLKDDGIVSFSVPTPDSLKKWGTNMLKERRLDLIIPTLVAVVVRKIFLGKSDFQPIDHDLSLEEWAELIENTGFKTETQVYWPDKEGLEPLASLISARKLST